MDMTYSRAYKTEAIILKRKNLGEADRIVTVYSKEYGKLRVIAKGIRRITSRRAPSLEPFNKVALFLHRGKTFDIVTDAGLVLNYPNLRKDLKTVNAAYYYSELVDAMLADRQEHRDVYVLLEDALEALDKPQDVDLYGSTEVFALSLLRILGFLPTNRELASAQIQPFIEQIVERRIRTYKFLRQ